MNERWREAARRRLAERSGSAPEGRVEGLTLDVAAEGTRELVSVRLRDGELACASTGGPEGPHVAVALSWLAGEPAAVADLRSSSGDDVPRVSWPPAESPVAQGEPDAKSARARLAEALDDLLTVLARAGLDSFDTAAFAESLDRLRKEAPVPLPTGLARWQARLRDALEAGYSTHAAHLLTGAARLADDLRIERPGPAERVRVSGWLGGNLEAGAQERLSDRVLVEVSREWLSSTERGGMERRYLVDARDGGVFVEERSRAGFGVSVGPCPRVVQVGLAEVERGACPSRLRLMQYSVSGELSSDERDGLEAHAHRRFASLVPRYRELLEAHPGVAEPFVLVVPAAVEDEAGVAVLYDEQREPLMLARDEDPAAVELLCRYAPTSPPRWVAGRLVHLEGVLCLVPTAAMVAGPEGDRFVRLR